MPVAQLDRASDCGSEGWKFKSSQARCYIRKDVRAGRRSTIGSRVCLTAPWVRIPLFPYTCSFYFYISYNGALRQLMMNPPGSEGSNGKSTQLGASSPVIRGFFINSFYKSHFYHFFIFLFVNILTKTMYFYTMYYYIVFRRIF